MQEPSTAWEVKQKATSRLQHLEGQFAVPSRSEGVSFERQMRREPEWMSESKKSEVFGMRLVPKEHATTTATITAPHACQAKGQHVSSRQKLQNSPTSLSPCQDHIIAPAKATNRGPACETQQVHRGLGNIPRKCGVHFQMERRQLHEDSALWHCSACDNIYTCSEGIRPH